MKASPRKTRRLLLAGGGHSHLEVLRRFAMDPDPLTEIVIMSPTREALYSGMLPGFLSRQYSWDDIVLDVAALASRAGAVLVPEAVTRIDAAEKLVFGSRSPLSYDVLSLDIGSATALPPLGAGVAEFPGFIATRPFTQFRERLPQWDKDAERPGAELLVIGSGAAGFELACCLRARYPKAILKLLEGSFGIPAHQRHTLARLGVIVENRGSVQKIELRGESLEVQAGNGPVWATHVVCATGARAHSLIQASGLAHTHGFLRVNERLQSETASEIFGAGDCVHFSPSEGLAKSGVYAVRAAPFLFANLRAALRGESLTAFHPQKRFLRLLNVGDGSAIAEWGSFHAKGAWAWRWKDRIDRRFLSMYRMEMPPNDEPDCGGCGSKAAADVVCELRAPAGPRSGKAVWGTEAAEDVALWEGRPGARIAISVDQFKNFGLDPWNLGRITAIAAASDLYAKGVAPEAALMTLTMPKLSSRLAKDWARQLNEGVRSVFDPEGVEVLGGHTTEGEEWSCGFTVWGAAGDSLWPKRGARAGDRLLLTKPLGTGILLAAHMQGVQLGHALTECVRSMSVSQRESWEILRKAEVHACTDVTGFSLLGHLSEMLEGTGLSSELSFGKIPFLPQARELFARGYRSRMHELNQRSFPVRFETAEASVLFDSQTSGGLLVAVPEAESARLATALGAAEIGRITGSSYEKIRVLP